MAETTQSKRQREDEHCQCEEDTKRHKSCSQVLNVVEEDEVDPNQDLLDIFQSLQQELSSDPSSADPLQVSATTAEADRHAGLSATSESGSPSSKEDDENEDRVRMMRHLLEASDDELGLPSRSESGDEEINSGENTWYSGEGLWELEDDAANYYTLLLAELFK